MPIRCSIFAMLVLWSSSALASSSVTTVEKAVACPDIGSFEDYFAHEVKEGVIPEKIPSNCRSIQPDTKLTLVEPLDGKVQKFNNKLRRFFLVQSPSEKAQQLWIPSYFLSKPSTP